MAKATPVKNMIEKKKQYVPMPSIDRSNRRNNNPTFAVSAPITQVTNTIAFPCWPIPLCNTITADQIIDFANEVNAVVTGGIDVVSNDANNIIIAGTDGWSYLNIDNIKNPSIPVNLVANTEFTLAHNYNIEYPQVVVYWPDNKVTDVEVKYIDANTVKLLSTETINANVRISF